MPTPSNEGFNHMRPIRGESGERGLRPTYGSGL